MTISDNPFSWSKGNRYWKGSNGELSVDVRSNGLDIEATDAEYVQVVEGFLSWEELDRMRKEKEEG